MASSSSSLNHDVMMLLEAPFARVPHDELRSYLRTQQRFVERDLTFCSTTLETMAKSSHTSSGRPSSSAMAPSGMLGATASSATQTPAFSGSSTPHVDSVQGESGLSSREAEEQADMSAVDASLLADVSFAASDTIGEESLLASGAPGTTAGDENIATTLLANKSGSELDRSLDVMIGRIKGLKRKLAQVHESTGSTLTRLEARTSHLDEINQIKSTSSPAFDEWCRTRLDRMLVDWMLRKGFAKSAEVLAKNRKIENYVDLNLFAEIERIEASLTGRASVKDAEGNDQVQERSCVPSLAWCSENKASLRKIRSTLEFDLRLQEYIELTRTRTPESLREAIAYSRRYLLPYLASSSVKTVADDAKGKAEEKEEGEEKEQQEMIRMQVARVMGLLACGPNGWAYGDLYSESRWQTLRGKFRAAALQIHSLPPQPLLHIALSAGLSSLKLPACYADDHGQGGVAPPAHLGGRAFGDERSNLLSVSGVSSTSIAAPPTFPPAAGVPTIVHEPPSVVLTPPHSSSLHSTAPASSNENGRSERNTKARDLTKNDNCPVCDPKGLGILAKEVPWSHHANSTLVCIISGRIMDENDPPMALPNGRVYSTSALKEMASNSHDGSTVVCPRTGSEFQMDQLRKVYIS